ncbi:MAG: hypothetical protein H0X51_07995 [Parachlamydiaceae bacterium]|nr:hypothetical protein [Parachlamydiaceae bacterium]
MPDRVVVKKLDAEWDVVANLSIDFSDNKLTTYFQGKVKSVSLSSTLGMVRDLSEIFATIQASAKADAEKLSSFEEEFNKALVSTESCKSDTKLKIDGKEVIAFYPSVKRVVLTTSRGESSIPIEMIQNCAHLFDRAFAKDMCPLLGVDGTGVSDLLRGIRHAYIGRCILGLAKSFELKYNSVVKQSRELNRIVALMDNAEVLYSDPIL